MKSVTFDLPLEIFAKCAHSCKDRGFSALLSLTFTWARVHLQYSLHATDTDRSGSFPFPSFVVFGAH